jgi:glycosyltransferase involved in cell wall biosynthesis
MRFLMLNWRDPHNPLSGGAERVTLGYLAALAKRGHEVYWFAYSFPGAAAESSIDGVRIVRAGERFGAVRAARRWYREQKRFDLVIDQHHGIPWYAPWWCGTHCVAYIHEVLGPIWDAFYRWPLNVIGRHQEHWTHWLYRKVPFWTACPSTKHALHAAGVRDVTLIPYGVHTVALPQLDDKPLSTPLRLAVVSRLAPNKRVDHAVRAVKCLRDHKVAAELTIVGAGSSEEGLRQSVSELGLQKCVSFAGPLDESKKDERLQQAHWLLHTSIREGWGLNVIEANALGTPGAVYPVPGLIESTLHDQTGLVSAVETPESLAQALIGILGRGDKYQELRRAAWERAKTFHWDQVLPKACGWLESMAKGENAQVRRS